MKKGLKRLSLNRETLHSLTQPALNRVLGGALRDGIVDTGCNSECTECAVIADPQKFEAI